MRRLKQQIERLTLDGTDSSRTAQLPELPAPHDSEPTLAPEPQQSGSLFNEHDHVKGLRIVRDRPHAQIDVILVHGLNGNGFKTWRHPTGTHWPSTLLPEDLPDARILSFGYDAEVTRMAGPVGQSHLRNHATSLVADYASLRNLEVDWTRAGSVGEPDGRDDDITAWGPRRVVIICHSLGGLVCKKAITLSAESLNPAERLLDRQTCGICFLGTPHRGSDVADPASFLAAGLKLAGKRVNRQILQLLRPSSEVLADAHSSFGSWLRRNHERCELACFYEEHEVLGVGMIVSQQSATVDGYRALPIPSDHTGMVKFASKDDIGYIRLVGQVKSMLVTRQSSHPEPLRAISKPEAVGDLEACLDALSYPEQNASYSMIRDAEQTTCSWLTNHDYYKQWETSNHNIVLWLVGIPGSGKSTLMKHAVDHQRSILRASRHAPTIILSHFFATQGSELQRSIEGLFRSLLFQLLEAVPNHMVHLLKVHRQLVRNAEAIASKGFGASKRSIWSYVDMMSILEICLSSILESSHVLLFIDGLNECVGDSDGDGDGDGEATQNDDIRRFIKNLSRVRAQTPATHCFRVCYSCQRHPELSVLDKGSEISVDKDNIDSIRKFLRDGIDVAMEMKEAPMQARIFSVVQSKLELHGSGSFLWAKLVLKQIQGLYHRGQSTAQIIRSLQDLPQNQEEIYHRMLLSVPRADHSQSLKLFRFVCFSTEPWTIPTLRFAMNMITDKLPFSISDIESQENFIESNSQMERLIRSLSGGLLELSLPGVSTYDDLGLPDYMRTYMPQALEAGLSDHTARYLSQSAPALREVIGANIKVATGPSAEGWSKRTIEYLEPNPMVKTYMMSRGFRTLQGPGYDEQSFVTETHLELAETYMASYALSEWLQAKNAMVSQYSLQAMQKRAVGDFGLRDDFLKTIKSRCLDPEYTRDVSFLDDLETCRYHLRSLATSENETDVEVYLSSCHEHLLLYHFWKGDIPRGVWHSFQHIKEARRRSANALPKRFMDIFFHQHSVLWDALNVAMVAVFTDFPDVLESVLSIHDPEKIAYMHNFLLSTAVMYNSFSVADFLLRMETLGSDDGVSDIDERLTTMCVADGNREGLDFLLNHEIIVPYQDRKAELLQVLLCVAITLTGDEQICDLLIRHGADVNGIDESGSTPLMHAAKAGRTGTVKLLLSKGADVSAIDARGQSVLHAAVFGKDPPVDLMKALLFGLPPLLNPILLPEGKDLTDVFEPILKTDNAPIFSLLMQRVGAAEALSHPVSVVYAASLGARKCIRVLLDDYSQDVNMITQDRTALQEAILCNHRETVEYLLSRADVSASPVRVRSCPLSDMIWCKWPPESAPCQMLLSHPTLDVNQQLGQTRTTPLRIACYDHEMAADGVEGLEPDQTSPWVAALLTHPGFDGTVEDINGDSALHTAARLGQAGIVRQLLSHPTININHRNKYQETALSVSVCPGRLAGTSPKRRQRAQAAEVLLRHPGVEVNAMIPGKSGEVQYIADRVLRSLWTLEERQQEGGTSEEVGDIVDRITFFKHMWAILRHHGA